MPPAVLGSQCESPWRESKYYFCDQTKLLGMQKYSSASKEPTLCLKKCRDDPKCVAVSSAHGNKNSHDTCYTWSRCNGLKGMSTWTTYFKTGKPAFMFAVGSTAASWWGPNGGPNGGIAASGHPTDVVELWVQRKTVVRRGPYTFRLAWPGKGGSKGAASDKQVTWTQSNNPVREVAAVQDFARVARRLFSPVRFFPVSQYLHEPAFGV